MLCEKPGGESFSSFFKLFLPPCGWELIQKALSLWKQLSTLFPTPVFSSPFHLTKVASVSIYVSAIFHPISNNPIRSYFSAAAFSSLKFVPGRLIHLPRCSCWFNLQAFSKRLVFIVFYLRIYLFAFVCLFPCLVISFFSPFGTTVALLLFDLIFYSSTPLAIDIYQFGNLAWEIEKYTIVVVVLSCCRSSNFILDEEDKLTRVWRPTS